MSQKLPQEKFWGLQVPSRKGDFPGGPLVKNLPANADMSFSNLQEMVKDSEAWRAAVHGVAESDMTEWLNNNNNNSVLYNHTWLVTPVLDSTAAL